MRKINALVDCDVVARAEAHGGAGKIAEAIDRDAGGLGKTGDEKGRGQVCQVMFHLVQLGLELRLVLVLESVFNRNRAANVFDLLQHQARRGPVGRHETEPAPVVDAGVAIDADVFDLAQVQPCFAQAIVDRLGRQPRPMLDAAKTFLLGRGHKFAIDEQAGRRVSVVSVQTQNDHFGTISDFGLRIADFKPDDVFAVRPLVTNIRQNFAAFFY